MCGYVGLTRFCPLDGYPVEVEVNAGYGSTLIESLHLQQPENVAETGLDLLLAFITNDAEFFLQGRFRKREPIIALANRRPFKAVRAVQAHVNLGRLTAQGEARQSVERGELVIGTAFIAADDDKVMRLLKPMRLGLPDFKLTGIHRSRDCGILNEAFSSACRSSSSG